MLRLASPAMELGWKEISSSIFFFILLNVYHLVQLDPILASRRGNLGHADQTDLGRARYAHPLRSLLYIPVSTRYTQCFVRWCVSIPYGVPTYLSTSNYYPPT